MGKILNTKMKEKELVNKSDIFRFIDILSISMTKTILKMMINKII